MKLKLQILLRAEGAEIAEAALVLPVVFLFLMGIIWFGRAFNIYSTIQQAAQQGAITAARPTCATCGNAFSSGPSYTAVVNAVTSIMKASNLDPGQITSNPVAGCLAPSNITVCQQVELNSTATPPATCATLTPPNPTPTPAQICGAIVTFKYPFQFSLPFTSLNWSTIYLYAQAQSRMEN